MGTWLSWQLVEKFGLMLACVVCGVQISMIAKRRDDDNDE